VIAYAGHGQAGLSANWILSVVKAMCCNRSPPTPSTDRSDQRRQSEEEIQKMKAQLKELERLVGERITFCSNTPIKWLRLQIQLLSPELF
jgi:hypothetical protein